ncbi:MAG: type II toxin-antitoxin system RelE/ParE family toxin [Spirochaetales bacterium]|nr:type II toxin-antitoxin system RelE/ParE family toxin [Spirochaetales bacterium]MBO7349044.1 type II toxin-antitoxin system RelE/ParE family toxin [Spirochaetales bacterium]
MIIKYSRQFIEDVSEISNYVSNELNNPSSAEKLKASFFEEIERLSDSPFLGEALPPPFQVFGRNLRRLVFRNYLIIYSVSEQIVIERVLYAKRDWMRLLSPESQNL